MTSRLTSRLGGFALLLSLQGGALTPEERRLVDAWHRCVECEVALDSLRAVATRKPIATVDTLDRVLTGGLTAREQFLADSVLGIAYGRDSSYRARTNLAPLEPRATYVQWQRQRHDNLRRVRAAQGLGWIHDTRAVAALNNALNLPLQPTVRAAVLYARDSLPKAVY